MNRLWVKLTLAFLVIALAAIGLVAAVSARATGDQFRRYVFASDLTGQAAWVESLTAYYAAHGSWDGVADLLAQLGPGPAAGRGRGRVGSGNAGPNLAVADPTGRLVASRTGELVGEVLPSATLAQGLPLTLDGRPIGTLINLRPAGLALDAQGETFLRQVQASLIWAGALAALLALVLGVLVSRLLTAPLARLTHAAQAIAGGNLSQQVQVEGNDEIATLSRAFNEMSTSLAAAEAARKNMLADISHELRTPLTVIQGDLQAILDGVYPLEMAQVAGLYDETRLLTRLVEDLHDLALADAGQLRLQREPVDLAALARAAVAQFAPVAEAAGVKLTLEIGATPTVTGDADRLAQVLRNLLSNALRHTPAGGTIAVRVMQADDRAQLAVADTGRGIAAADLPHIFDRFYQGDQEGVRRGRGAGLGLAITQQLVLAHSGQITVTSPPGEGTTFIVTLPISTR